MKVLGVYECCWCLVGLLCRLCVCVCVLFGNVYSGNCFYSLCRSMQYFLLNLLQLPTQNPEHSCPHQHTHILAGSLSYCLMDTIQSES